MAQEKITRLELLNTKRKLKLAKKGHDLLKKKRDVLIMEFFSLLREIQSLRGTVGDKLIHANNALKRAEGLMGPLAVERALEVTAKDVHVNFKQKKVMAVPVPVFESIELTPEWYGLLDTVPDYDVAINEFRSILPALLKLLTKQLALSRIAEEIKTTKRKANSLEYIMIPRMESIKKMISFKLEEMERDNFMRLEKIIE